MNRVILFITVLSVFPSDVTATSGWDRHELRFFQYRIHGKNGSSFVHRVSANGSNIEPRLCSNLDASGMNIGLGCPPDYAVTETHIAIRYPGAVTANSPPNHFLIRIEDGHVTGPLTATEFMQLPVASSTRLEWKTPSTAADEFHRFVTLTVTCSSFLFAGGAVLIVKWLWNRRVRPNDVQGD